MFPDINPTQTKAWQSLLQLYSEVKNQSIKSLFEENDDRFQEFSETTGDILFDYSKNNISEQTRSLLLQLAAECKLDDAIAAMFSGERINKTEDRPVLHTALRNFSGKPVYVDGKDVMPDIKKVQEQMRDCCTRIHDGSWTGFSGKKIRYIVNIGIGGSDLGPVMVTEALKPYWVKGMQAFFVSNVDGTHIAETFKKIQADEALFLIASKTFTTQETMTNAHSAREWFLQQGGTEKDIARHFVALSTNQEAVEAFGIDAANMFVFWDWVGGRYSLWSAIGLSIALTVGYGNFELLLKGAFHSDKHFQETDFKNNIPGAHGIDRHLVP